MLRVDSDFDYSQETMRNRINVTAYTYCFFLGREIPVVKSVEALMLDEDGEPIFMRPLDGQSFRKYMKAFHEAPDELKYANVGDLEEILRILEAGVILDEARAR